MPQFASYQQRSPDPSLMQDPRASPVPSTDARWGRAAGKLPPRCLRHPPPPSTIPLRPLPCSRRRAAAQLRVLPEIGGGGAGGLAVVPHHSGRGARRTGALGCGGDVGGGGAAGAKVRRLAHLTVPRARDAVPAVAAGATRWQLCARMPEPCLMPTPDAPCSRPPSCRRCRPTPPTCARLAAPWGCGASFRVSLWASAARAAAPGAAAPERGGVAVREGLQSRSEQQQAAPSLWALRALRRVTWPPSP